MMKSSTSHNLLVVISALIILGAASAVPWSTLTNNKLKDFDLLSDILPASETQTNTSEQTPDIGPNNHIVIEDSISDNSTATNIQTTPGINVAVGDSTNTGTISTDSTSLFPINAIQQDVEAPRIDGHVVIENYTGAEPLARFRAALSQATNRRVRIAIVGDSFIEGDIFVQDVRAKLQEQYGGCGVGYVPIYSPIPGFRRSVRQSGNGWEMTTIQNMSRRDSIRTLATEYGTSTAGAWAQYRGTSQSGTTEAWNRSAVTLLASDSCSIILKTDSITRTYTVGPSAYPQTFEIVSHTSKFRVETSNASLKVLGVYLDGNTGICVDCMSTRGSSGLNLASIRRRVSRSVDYDLIILEFGCNALSASRTEYNGYRTGMNSVIERVKELFPNADILVMGIADRGTKDGNVVRSLPSCTAMTAAQRGAAQTAGVHFYDTRAAQGGENAIVEWRQRRLVNADYIHLNHDGGYELATEFMQGLNLTLQQTQ